MKSLKKLELSILSFILILFSCNQQPTPPERTDDPFPGERGEVLDNYARYDMWDTEPEGFLANFTRVPRSEVVAFAIYTHDRGKLKITAQMYPLMPEESQFVTLEMQKEGKWKKIDMQPVIYPGWSAHFKKLG